MGVLSEGHEEPVQAKIQDWYNQHPPNYTICVYIHIRAGVDWAFPWFSALPSLGLGVYEHSL